ncbi:fatty acid synthase alpha subunit Lsd1, partial [Linderina pennispora]
STIEFPHARSFEDLQQMHYLQGMLNLDKVVVIVGYGEVGPYGSSACRWEMEAYGELSLEGCIELAWIMGLIKRADGKNGYFGWVDAASENPIDDYDIKPKYESYILEHTGIRLIEPEMTHGYDPKKKLAMRELHIEHDLEPFVTTAEEAADFKRQNGDGVDSWLNSDGSWSVRFLKGATLMVPKAINFDRHVAAQLPTGWSPEVYGIPKDIVDQVDPITCQAIVATVEALMRSGITDPYELYRYMHVSQVGSSVGSGIGGAWSMRRMYRDRLVDKEVQGDIVQESLINTVNAYLNMLLLSSSGAIKPTVGACGTAIVSIDVAVDTIQSGKAKVMLAGGCDDFSEEGSYEFGQMMATSNTLEEFARGRMPNEMSRPCTSTRSGFVESGGAGIVVLMSASAAIEMGVPVYGIVAMTSTATDKEGRSVPAPGQGILTTARERTPVAVDPTLDINYRRQQLDHQRGIIGQWVHEKRNYVKKTFQDQALQEHLSLVDIEAKRLLKSAQDTWSMDIWRDSPYVSPLRASLATWGLTIDDIGVASFHGTSTKANDLNESRVLNRQLQHLGRGKGNVLPIVCQKWLTGHPKGAAAAWMLNGAVQSLHTGIIPGNRNADNIDAELEEFEHLLYPSRTIRTSGIKACILKSFGFGQVGGEIVVVHPDYILAVLSRGELDAYQEKVGARK